MLNPMEMPHSFCPTRSRYYKIELGMLLVIYKGQLGKGKELDV